MDTSAELKEWNLNYPVSCTNKFTVQLFDEDSPDEDDDLGTELFTVNDPYPTTREYVGDIFKYEITVSKL